MANNKSFVLNNPVSVGKAAEFTVGTSTSSNSVGFEFARFVSSFYVGGQETVPYGVTFKPDGTKMYVIGTSGDRVWPYSLSTAWDISTASYDGDFFSVAGQDTAPLGLTFSSDGTKLFVAGNSGNTIEQYTLTTAWDVTGTVTLNTSFATVSVPSDVVFNSDGTKMFVLNAGNDVHQYTLSTAYDLTGTVTNDGAVFSVPSQGYGIGFNSDGTEFYIGTASTTDTIYKYTLSTAFDLSTATDTGLSLYVGDLIPNYITFYVKPDSTSIFVVGTTTDKVHEYSLESETITFDLSTGNYFKLSITGPTKVAFSNAGSVQSFQLEVTGNNNTYDFIDLNYTEKQLNISSEDVTPQGVFLKPDGTRLYFVGATGDTVHQYTLSTAWDITTATLTEELSVSSEEPTPTDLHFKPDGTKLFIVGHTGDEINQYDLDVAWSVGSGSTAGTPGSVATEDSSPQAIFFKPDGTKVYVVGDTGNDVMEYSLSTAWDVSSTLTLNHTLSVSTEETTPNGIWFKSDGTKMYIAGGTGRNVDIYNLSTAWDLSTASYSGLTAALPYGQYTEGIYISPEGDKFYTIDAFSDAIFQYDLYTIGTITWDDPIEWSSGNTPDAIIYDKKNIYTFITDDGGTTYSAFPTAVNIG